MSSIPPYSSLPFLDDLDIRHAWDACGRDDVLGSVRNVSPDTVRAASECIVTGERFNLDLPADQPSPPFHGRESAKHTVFSMNRNVADDRLDGFFPQGSSQWDSLAHVRCREHGYWGGRQSDPWDGPIGLGIHQWAEVGGIVGRGLLIDVGRWAAGREPDYDPMSPRRFTAAEIGAVLDDLGIVSRPGDVWCIRTGWTAAYLRLTPDERVAYAESAPAAGLSAEAEVAEMLWNAQPAAVCSDNPAVEAMPRDLTLGSLHRRLLPTLGLALGEMFALDDLASACARDSRWTFFFAAKPINLPNGIGSPANALAIR
jgi:hypothetical protein